MALKYRAIASAIPIKKIGAFFATIFLMLTTLVLMSSAVPAHAAETNETIVDSHEVNWDNSVSPIKIEDGKWYNVKISWHVKGEANPDEPVTVEVPIPDGFHGQAESYDVEGPGGTVIGTCTISATHASCTLDEDYVKANPVNLRGEFDFNMRTEFKNRDEDENLPMNGWLEDSLTVSPSTNWCDEECEYSGHYPGKAGSYYMDDGEEYINWYVYLPGDTYDDGSAEDPSRNAGIKPGLDVTVEDILDEEQYQFVSARVERSGYLTYDQWERQGVGAYSTVATFGVDEAGYTWSDNGLKVEFKSQPGDGETADNEIEAPNNGSRFGTNGSFYRVVWKTKVLKPGILQEDGSRTFSNKAKWNIDGDNGGDLDGGATTPKPRGSAIGTNYGGFELTKSLKGDTSLGSTQEFQVTYTVYADEFAEGSMTFTETVKAGNSIFSPTFYKGSRVVIEELLDTTEPANVDWTAPEFIDANGNPLPKNAEGKVEITFDQESGNLGKRSKWTLVNEASLQKQAAFSAKKKIDNVHTVPVAQDTFRLNYSYPADPEKGIPASGGVLELAADGTPTGAVDLPVGAVVTLTESSPETIPGATWQSPTIEPSTFTVGEQEDPIDVTVTNTLTQDFGGFTLTKSVEGDGTELIPEGTLFTVNYEYTAVNGSDAGSGSVEVAAGESVTIEGIPATAEVTLTEVTPVDPVGATWGEPVFDVSTFTVVKDTNVAISLDNPISWNNGNFSVMKQVEGDAADRVAEDAAFTVDYVYTLPEKLSADPATGEGSLTVLNDGEAVVADPLPYDTEVTLTEATPIEVPGATWTGWEFDPETFNIGDETTIEVVLTNFIELDLGDFTLEKLITGTGAELISDDTAFTVEYSYPEGYGFEAGDGSVTVTPGTPATVADLPAGAVVTLEEITPEDPENGYWVEATFADGNIVVIGKDESKTVTLENEYNLGFGGFNIVKEVIGTGADLVDDDVVFTVQYTYPAGPGFDAGEGTVNVTADGTVETITDLPAGAELTLTELSPVDVDGATWTGHEFSADTITIGKEDYVDVTLTNEVDKIVTPGENLSNTGGNIPIAALIGGAFLLLAGTTMLVANTRRKKTGVDV